MSEEQHWYMSKKAATAMAAELEQTRQKLAEAQADCAAKAAALRQTFQYHLSEDYSDCGDERIAGEFTYGDLKKAQTALASTAGDALVKELERLRAELLEWQTIGADVKTQKELTDLRAQRDQAVLLARELGEVLDGCEPPCTCGDYGTGIHMEYCINRRKDLTAKRTAVLAKLARKRKLTPHQKIMRAASRGRGLRLSPQEVLDLSRDDAIETRATLDHEATRLASTQPEI